MKRTSLCLLGSLLFCIPAGAGTILELTWNVSPGSGSDFITTGNTERGIAWNNAASRLLLATRAVSNRVIVIDPSNGELIHELATTGIAGGNGNALNMVGAAEDGAVYACNLIVASGTNAPGAFKIYRWPSDAAGVAPTIAFNGDPSGTTGDPPVSVANLRWGDTLAVRGSGTDTQILCGSGATAICIFTTTDGTTFTPHFIDGVLESGGSKGIAFGAGDTIYSKANGNTKKLRRSSFNLAGNTAALLNDITVSPNPGIQFIPIAIDLANKWWGTFETGSAGPEVVKLYDLGVSGTTPVLHHSLPLPNDNANGNAVGSTALGNNMLFVCDTNNGLQGYSIVVTPDAVAPTVTSSPASRSVLDRGQTTFNVVATGTPPLTYKWFKDDVEIGSGPSLTVNPVAAASVGVYKCTVSNTAGSADSTGATLTVLPSVNTNALTECWRLVPGSRAYLQNDDTQRGLDYDPMKGRLYLVSRTPAPAVHVLSATDGADLGALGMGDIANATIHPGATFPINMIGVAGDGAIFACNLSSTTDGSNFRLFRWADDDSGTIPTLVYQGTLFDTDDAGPIAGTRCGDTMDVRGSGTDTQIVIGARLRNQFAVFRTADGTSFSPTVYTVSGASATAFGLGAAFGEGNTLWGKMSGQPLTFSTFDDTGNATLAHTIATANFSSSAGAIGVDPAAGCLAALATENSDNVRLYRLPVPFPVPGPSSLPLLDQEFFATDNDNGNGTGSVVVKNGKVFALDSFNGIVCHVINKPPGPEIGDVAYNPQAGQFTFTLKGTPGRTYLIQRSPNLAAWTDDGTETLAAASQQVVRAASGPVFFFRAREQ